MTPTLYGIPNCDTVKKARTWLEGRGVDYVFHDYKKAGIDRASLEQWCDEHGWETVLNRAGTTFRKLPEADRADLDQDRAIALMLAQPSMIKRPVLDLGDRRIVGFKPEIYEAAFATACAPGSGPGLPPQPSAQTHQEQGRDQQLRLIDQRRARDQHHRRIGGARQAQDDGEQAEAAIHQAAAFSGVHGRLSE